MMISMSDSTEKVMSKFILMFSIIPFVGDITKVLHSGIRVLIYAGDADFICNWIGNKKWVMKLNWKYKKNFAEVKDSKWTDKSGNKKFGECRTYKNLSFVRVFNAGHMVPYDQPEASYEMLSKWLKGHQGF